MKCSTVTCAEAAEFNVLWPGKTCAMCLRCAHRAVLIGQTMGVDIAATDMEWVDALKKLADAARRLGDVGGIQS